VKKVHFSFLDEPDTAQLPLFKNIGRNPDAPIWVNKAEQESLEKDARSLKEYGNKLLWEFVFSHEDVELVRQNKQKSVGFAKVVGKPHIKAFFGNVRSHLLRAVSNVSYISIFFCSKTLLFLTCCNIHPVCLHSTFGTCPEA
jgi:hypothetical protein